MNNICAIFKKQMKDTFKNKTILIQFVMFPVLTILINSAVKIDGMPERFFVNLFAAMYAAMAPLTSIAAIIAEEKEKNTLRVLRMSNVKPHEYLLGVGSSVWLACMLGSAVICAAGNYGLKASLFFMSVMAAGILASLLIGAAIGTGSRTQMAATSVTVPVMMIVSFLPMLATFNETIAQIAEYVYSQQVSCMLSQADSLHVEGFRLWIIAVNMGIAGILFRAAYKKCGLA